jgi:acetoin utilization deacetylase AcuC-like enzyme
MAAFGGGSHPFTLVAWYSFRMLIVASDAHRAHHPRVPFLDRGQLIDPPEVPERVDRILEAIVGREFGEPQAPVDHGRAPITRVHSPEYVDFLEDAHERWRADTGLDESSEAAAYARPIRDQPLIETDNIIADLGWYSHDTDPILAGTFTAAVGAVDVTLTAWDAVADGRETVAYACARPPGHHAAVDSFAGYCYLNNAAIAAQAWTDRGARVAIIDVDYHHGNGTQQIFYDRGDVLVVSLHADPAFDYPFFLGFAGERGWGAGEDANLNFPLPEGTDWDRYGPALDAALAAVRKFGPDAVIVSLGVDTAVEDPDSFRLAADDYPRLGAKLATLTRPTLVVQEGGYNLAVLGRNVAAVLREVAALG